MPIERTTHQPVQPSKIANEPPTHMQEINAKPIVWSSTPNIVNITTGMEEIIAEIPSNSLTYFPAASILHSKAIILSSDLGT